MVFPVFLAYYSESSKMVQLVLIIYLFILKLPWQCTHWKKKSKMTTMSNEQATADNSGPHAVIRDVVIVICC